MRFAPLAVLAALAAAPFALAQQVEPEILNLPNGMKFLLVPRYDQPNTVAAGWLAKVGSVNERPGITGISHFFEHMMFKGTDTIGTRDSGRDAEYRARQKALRDRINELTWTVQYDRFKKGEIADAWDPKFDTPELARLRADLEGRRAALYVGGAFKAFSLVRALRQLGMRTVMAGTQTGGGDDYEHLKSLVDPDTIIADDTNPLELAAFLQSERVDLFIGGVKERPIAYKLGIGFCDHNHERKIGLAGFAGMVSFAREVHATVTSPVWSLMPRQRSVP